MDYFKKFKIIIFSVTIALMAIQSSAAKETIYTKIKLRLGVHLITDQATRTAAREANDDIATTIGTLSNAVLTDEEIATRLGWKKNVPLLLAPQSLYTRIIGEMTPAGRKILRQSYALKQASNWRLIQPDLLSVDIFYADASKPSNVVIEKQKYKKQNDAWCLIEQRRLSQQENE